MTDDTGHVHSYPQLAYSVVFSLRSPGHRGNKTPGGFHNSCSSTPSLALVHQFDLAVT